MAGFLSLLSGILVHVKKGRKTSMMSGYGPYKDRKDWLLHDPPAMIKAGPDDLTDSQKRQALADWKEMLENGSITLERFNELDNM